MGGWVSEGWLGDSVRGCQSMCKSTAVQLADHNRKRREYEQDRLKGSEAQKSSIKSSTENLLLLVFMLLLALLSTVNSTAHKV